MTQQESDLPLLSWRPRGQVIVFPFYSRHGQVTQIAETLLHKHGVDANIFWKQVIASNRERLAQFGLSESEQDAQLQQLHDAVQEVMAWTVISRHEGGT